MSEELRPEGSLEAREKGPDKESVIARIQEAGLNPETFELIGKWLDVARTQELSGTETAQTNIDLSDFYAAGGDFTEAESCLSQAMYQAQQEDDETRYLLAQSKLRALDELREGK